MLWITEVDLAWIRSFGRIFPTISSYFIVKIIIPKRYFAIIVQNGSTLTLLLTSDQEKLCQQRQEGAFVGNSCACESFSEVIWKGLNQND